MARIVRIPVMSFRKTYMATVDYSDYSIVKDYFWYPQEVGNTVYAASRIDGKVVFMHRLILGIGNTEQVDHKDRNGLNNRRKNLRFATVTLNQANTVKQAGFTSQYKGVCWEKYTRKWKASIGIGQTPHKMPIVRTLGRFSNEEDAARAYDRAALELWGEFAVLNPLERAV